MDELSRYAVSTATPYPWGFIHLDLDGWILEVGEMVLSEEPPPWLGILAKWEGRESNHSKNSNSLFRCTQAIKLSLTPPRENPRVQVRGEELKILLQKHAIFSSHKLSPHTHSQSLTWQECQAKEEAPHSPTSRIHPSKSKWMKPHE